VGLSLENIKTGEKIDVNGDTSFVAASTIKVLAAINFLHETENGKYTLSTSILGSTALYHLKQMISVSDNDSWYAFNKLLTYKGEKKYASSLGLAYDSIKNTITPNDMSTLLTKLYKKELLNSENTNLLLSFMRKTHNMTFIPGSKIVAKTYNKTGRIDGFVHDVAILDDGINQYALVIFTNGKITLAQRAGLFHEITEAVPFPKRAQTALK